LRRLPVRVDVQIETPSGAIALAEYAANLARVALRTQFGPRLVENPWQEER
jgi:phosphoribosyl-dephospho-CoA transferase